jgi:DNA-binding YbaB/EbfC family protein
MQAKMQELQDRAAETVVEGSSGGGLVRATLNGKNDLLGLKIDPSLVNPTEVEVLEDLIVVAFNDAKHRIDQQQAADMAKLTGGLALPPGFKLPF